jgi:GNAT superfamily N-acetyltransferase
LEALREAPYAFGSTLAEWQGDGDTEERWRARLCSVPRNFVAYLDGAPAGIASGTALDEDGTVELISMWVAPFSRGQGVGDALVDAVVDWARDRGADRVALAVVETNAQASRLYARRGFEDIGAIDCRNTGVASERQMVLDLKSQREARA